MEPAAVWPRVFLARRGDVGFHFLVWLCASESCRFGLFFDQMA